MNIVQNLWRIDDLPVQCVLYNVPKMYKISAANKDAECKELQK